ncbi:heparinase II/III family protein [Caulobacter mirabilis]|uniref:Heparinase n=1 Tax=Caulobacter mirabilis TaxID=69666 RepID=A0A2D2B359_9CAUL|nr:heparinase II/III family protein [Caulobacter mirabilis]ATQ44681.1 heparinase [Caulobacter mirabilis]
MEGARLSSSSSIILALQAAGEGARRLAEREWFGTPVHALIIARPRPEGLAANPRDLRPVEPERGRKILAGTLELAGGQLAVGPQGDPFDRASPNRRFAIALHRMDWMADLLSAGDAGARRGIRLVADWKRVFGRWNGFSWSPNVVERRVFNLACAARRLTTGASDAERTEFLNDLARQARHLARIRQSPERSLERAVAAGVAGCALGGDAGERLIDFALNRLARELPSTVSADGVHASRSPEAGLELLLDLLTLDDALHQRGRAGPEALPRAIDRLSAAVRFFTLPDGRLADFQGGDASSAKRIAAALAHEDSEARARRRAPHSGYERLESQALTIMADAAAPARGRWSATACAQPAALAISCGVDRIIVGCGWSLDSGASHALRLTDAASTANLADMSTGVPLRGFAAATLGERLIGGPLAVESRRQETEAAAWLEMSHEGWVKRFGLVHERKLYLDKATEELRGEDGFLPKVQKELEGPRRYTPFTVRFHVHPDAQASLARDKKSVLLKGAHEQGWWLRNDAVEVSIEPSLHVENGVQRRTVQVVLRGQASADKGGKVRWKLSRAEG